MINKNGVSWRWLRNGAAALVLAAGLGGCASVENDFANDPIEPVNRIIFNANRAVDAVFLRPVALWYRDITPAPVKESVRSFVRNLGAPLVLANDLLQGEGERGLITAQRFLINSTLGVAGLFDVAEDFGLVYHDEDFGQTLAVWGIGGGPYVMLPLLGPSNLRDTVGLVADYFLDPVNYAARNWRGGDYEAGITGRSGVEAVDSRSLTIEQLDEIERTSLDYYAAVRSLYNQTRTRADAVRNGAPAEGARAPVHNDAEDAFFDFEELPDEISAAK